MPVYILGFSALVHWPINLFLFKCYTVLIIGILFKPYNLLMQVFYSLFAFFRNILTVIRHSFFHFVHFPWWLPWQFVLRLCSLMGFYSFPHKDFLNLFCLFITVFATVWMEYIYNSYPFPAGMKESSSVYLFYPVPLPTCLTNSSF